MCVYLCVCSCILNFVSYVFISYLQNNNWYKDSFKYFNAFALSLILYFRNFQCASKDKVTFCFLLWY